jgi:hypothetical protein
MVMIGIVILQCIAKPGTHFHFVRILSLLNVDLLSMYIRITATSKPAEIMSRFVLLDSDTMPISPRIYSA